VTSSLKPTPLQKFATLSKIAVIFGPNAVGKTNFIVALATLRDLVLHSTSYSDEQFSERYTPFQFGPSAYRPTNLEIDVLLNEVRYRYAVSYDARRIRSERLLAYRTGKSQRWFERRFDEATQTDSWMPFSSSFHGPRDLWRKATRPTGLFLTTAAQLNSEQIKPLYHWFEHGLDIVLPSDTADLVSTAARLRNQEFKDRLLGLLHSLDIQVHDVRVAERDLAPAGQAATGEASPSHSVHTAGPPLIEFLYARSGRSPVWLDSMYEGAGTHRLLGLFGPLLDTMHRGKLLVIDEFDISLHPLVARFLLQLINDPRISDRGAQLLLTSHNTTLMSQDILRRDEIWLMQLDDNHASCLSPLLRSMIQTSGSCTMISSCTLVSGFGTSSKRRNFLPSSQTFLGCASGLESGRSVETTRYSANNILSSAACAGRRPAVSSSAAIKRNIKRIKDLCEGRGKSTTGRHCAAPAMLWGSGFAAGDVGG